MPDLADLFPGFDSQWIDTSAGKIFARSHGSGPPLILLHGFPQTHVMWHRIAPALAEKFTVVAMDLRGYGWSAVPRSHGGEAYAKRAMGADVVEVMDKLGHARCRIVGHDRGARVAYRLALDHPGRVEKLALLDIEPTFEVWKQIKAGERPGAHWDFLARPDPEPETEIGKDPIAYYSALLGKWAHENAFDPKAMEHYRAGWNEPTRIHASCEDYRAGATLDLAADEADMAAAKTIACPVHIVWGTFYMTQRDGESTLDVWRRTFAPGASGQRVDAGHFVAEENPDATRDALQSFL